jgi:CBS domain-containing protein
LTVRHALGPEPLPIRRSIAVSPETDLSDALRQMEESGAHQVVVEEEGRVIGVLTRERVAGYLRLRRETLL